MQGWAPIAIQVLTVALLVFAIGWRTRRWRLLWLPISALIGVSLAWLTHWNIATNGLAGDPAPRGLWVWLALSGLAGGVAVLGWRSADWRRRGASVLTVPMAMLCSALMLNLWVGYFPTIQTAWGQLTGDPLPGQTDSATVAKMLASTTVPAKGKVLPVTISSDASGFAHRTELVYLPPAYFASDPPPALPTVMMIGGQFNTAADWLRAGNAVATIDEFAAKHNGNAPVFVFVDSVGSFDNDTGCVNGARGDAADHLTKDVVPYMIDNFGVSDDPANWAVVGWSTGGTCAVNLTVKYPEVFSTFVNIDGDIAPNTGTKAQTIERLFGGDAAKYAEWDPTTLMTEHGRYRDVAGWFAVSTAPGTVSAPIPGSELPEPPENVVANTPVGAARALCGLGDAYGIDCAVVPLGGKHDWPFAERVLAASLPWLAARIETPDVPEVLLPGTATQPDGVSIAADGGIRATPTPRPTGVR